jgi:hypothetical protein
VGCCCAGCCAARGNAIDCRGIGEGAARGDGIPGLGIGIPCGLTDAVGEGGGVIICCSGTHRYPHFGQNLDLCGSASRHCGQTKEPQFLH